MKGLTLAVLLVCSVPLHDMADPVLVESAVQAAKTGDIPALQKLIPRYLSVDTTDEHGYPLVYFAATEGQENMMTWLLNQGANPCISPDYAYSTLGKAVPYPGILRKLLPYPFTDSHKKWALYQASSGPIVSLKLLLESGISPNFGWTPLEEATENGCWECAQLLLDAGAIGNEKHWQCNEVIPFVISNGLIGLCFFASDHNTCLSGTYTRHDEMLETALKILQRRPLQGEMECIQALEFAAFTDCPHLLSLVRSNLDRPIGYWPEICFAIRWGDIEALTQLIQLKNDWKGVGPNPFDLNHQNIIDSNTPLFLLARGRNFPNRSSVFKLLVENGADPNIKYYNRYSLIDYAAREGDLEMLELLIDAGVEWCPEFGTEDTLIRNVVESDYRDSLNLLLRKGASLPAIEEAFFQSIGPYGLYWKPFLESLHEDDLPSPP